MLFVVSSIKRDIKAGRYALWSGLWVQWSSWYSIGLVTERFRVRLTPSPLQATLSKLLTYCVLRPTQPPTLSGTGNE